MAPTLESSGHVGDDVHSEPHRGLRLHDAEELAEDRLECAAEGSVEAAFATAASEVPIPAEAQFANPIDAAVAEIVPDGSREETLFDASADETREMQSESEIAGQIEAVREELTVRDTLEDDNSLVNAITGEPPESEAAKPIRGEQPELARRLEAVEANFATGPLVRLIEARSGDAGHTPNSEPTYAFSSRLRPPALDMSVALVKATESARPPVPLEVLDTNEADEPLGNSIEEQQSVAGEAPPPPIMATAPDVPIPADRPMPVEDIAPMPSKASPRSVRSPGATAPPQNLQPLASALDAAVQLAADASVAAEALESLKRVLEHKQQLESRVPPSAPDTAPHPGSRDDASLASEPVAPARPPLPPLPLSPDEERIREPSRAMLPALRPRPTPERRGLDVRGFLAGFALSWAFGVVLYLFLTAG